MQGELHSRTNQTVFTRTVVSECKTCKTAALVQELSDKYKRSRNFVARFSVCSNKIAGNLFCERVLPRGREICARGFKISRSTFLPGVDFSRTKERACVLGSRWT